MARLRCRQGFTLLEVIMVIVVTAIAIPTLIVVMGQQARYTVDSEKIVIGTELGQELAEEIKGAGFGAAQSFDGFADVVALGGVSYSRSVSVCNVDPTDPDTCAGGPLGFKRVSITVSSDLGSADFVTLMTDH